MTIGVLPGSAPVTIGGDSNGQSLEVAAGRTVALGGVSVAGSLTVDIAPGAGPVALTSSSVTQAGASVTYAGATLKALDLALGTGTDSLAITSVPAGAVTTVDGQTGTHAVTTHFANNFGDTLDFLNVDEVPINVTGSVLATGSFTAPDFSAIAIGVNFAGSVTAKNPGLVQRLSVTGEVTAGGSITATNISNITIGTLAGAVIAQGGSISGANITSIAPTGLLQATEAPGVAGSGVMSNVTIGTNSGMVLAGSISGMKVGKNTPGAVIKAAGQGTTDDLSVGSNSGSIVAAEDSIAGMAESGTRGDEQHHHLEQ